MPAVTTLRLGTPLSPSATKVMLLGSGELGKEVVIELQRLGELDDRIDDLLKLAMSEHHRAEHHVLGQLLGLGLDHQHAFLRAGDDEV